MAFASVSSRRRRGSVVEPNLARLNLADAFEVMVFADDVKHGKPHPEGLLRALDSMALRPGATVYVGDTVVDLEMARAAGAPFAAVGTTTPGETFRAAGAARVWPGVGAWADALIGPA